MQTAIGLVVAGIGYALVPRSVQGLHRDGVVYLPLADDGVSSPVIMNVCADDATDLVAQFRALVREVARKSDGVVRST